jgi:alpha-1,2-glucosyltransferase
VSIIFRQNNVMWVCFTLGTAIVRDVEAAHGVDLVRTPAGGGKTGGKAKANDDAVAADDADADADAAASAAGGSGSPLAVVLVRFVAVLWRERVRLLLRFWAFLLLLLAFAAFVVVNGSVVVGDKSNHEAVLHFAQLPYFAVFAAALLGLELAAPAAVLGACSALRRQLGTALGVLQAAAAAGLLAGGVAKFSLTHKFLLADNRHYPFYLWQKFFRKHALAKFLPLPVYLYCAWALVSRLRTPQAPAPPAAVFAPRRGLAVAKHLGEAARVPTHEKSRQLRAAPPVTALWLVVFCLATALQLLPAHLVGKRGTVANSAVHSYPCPPCAARCTW